MDRLHFPIHKSILLHILAAMIRVLSIMSNTKHLWWPIFPVLRQSCEIIGALQNLHTIFACTCLVQFCTSICRKRNYESIMNASFQLDQCQADGTKCPWLEYCRQIARNKITQMIHVCRSSCDSVYNDCIYTQHFYSSSYIFKTIWRTLLKTTASCDHYKLPITSINELWGK